MAATTQTALDLITGALRNINQYAAGEALSASDAQDALQVMNDLFDSFSTNSLFIPSMSEFVTAWNPGQYQYAIGNPTSANTPLGTLTAGSNIITGITVPSDMIVNGDITDSSALLPANTTITAVGTTTVTVSANALGAATLDAFTYTVPGDFKVQRPLKMRDSFTRITSSGNLGLDYWIKVIALDNYIQKGYKGVPGPWPLEMSYQSSEPYGTLYIYPNPQQAGEVHLWMDQVLTTMTSVTQKFTMPQGYSRAFKKLLAIELAPEYGIEPSPELKRQAREATDFIRSMNASPTKVMSYDSALMRPNQNDAGWIMDGGFNR